MKALSATEAVAAIGEDREVADPAAGLLRRLDAHALAATAGATAGAATAPGWALHDVTLTLNSTRPANQPRRVSKDTLQPVAFSMSFAIVRQPLRAERPAAT